MLFLLNVLQYVLPTPNKKYIVFFSKEREPYSEQNCIQNLKGRAFIKQNMERTKLGQLQLQIIYIDFEILCIFLCMCNPCTCILCYSLIYSLIPTMIDLYLRLKLGLNLIAEIYMTLRCLKQLY